MFLLTAQAKDGGIAIYARTVTTQAWTQVDWVKNQPGYTDWLKLHGLEEQNPDIDELTTIIEDDGEPREKWGMKAATNDPNFRTPMTR